ncbi:MAG: hypothetical protein ACRD04_05650 [Terriglobales bacterium]
MTLIAAFHSVDEMVKPQKKRVYHNNAACSTAGAVTQTERAIGNGGYRLCAECERLDRAEAEAPGRAARAR